DHDPHRESDHLVLRSDHDRHGPAALQHGDGQHVHGARHFDEFVHDHDTADDGDVRGGGADELRITRPNP
ncbi:hypothetical protein, partial [Streptomyces sp. Agncl-13]|uniref:hypothetical protein n=1 Tax=Streptomyces sp. Agncl-13 TaxID=3400628 RepID=UPI003A8BDDE0